jgi:hypothetical protein
VCTAARNGPLEIVHPDAASVARELAEALVRACPTARPDDLIAKNACASELTSLPVLRDRMKETTLARITASP